MRSFSFSLDVPNVLAALEPALHSALRKYSSGRLPSDDITNSLPDWAERVYCVPPDDSLQNVLYDSYKQALHNSANVAALAIAFLISQFHFQREVPVSAREWNENAYRHLNGLPQLAQGAILAQRLSIETQSGNLKGAIVLDKRLATIRIPQKYRQLLAPPRRYLRIEKERALGTYDPRVISPELPPWNQALQRGRLLLQSAKYRQALKSFQEASRSLASQEEPSEPSFAIIELHVARALLGLVEHDEALRLFEKNQRKFAELPLHKADLSARWGVAEVLRIKGRHFEAYAILDSVLTRARTLGLGKEEFRALLSLAALATVEKEYSQARRQLESARRLLSDHDKKERCNLNRRKAEVEFRAGRRRSAIYHRRKAEELIPESAGDELAILRADFGASDVWSLLRRGRTAWAEMQLASYIGDLQAVLQGSVSDYRHEIFPKLYLSRLLRVKAYIDLRENRPASALKVSAGANALVRPLGDKGNYSFARNVFVEALAYAKLQDYPSSLAAFQELAELAQALGMARPILKCFEEIKTLDLPVIGNALALDVYRRFRSSAAFPAFRDLEVEFALAIDPIGSVELGAESKPLSEEGWRAVELFLRGYGEALERRAGEFTLISSPSQPAVDKFLHDYVDRARDHRPAREQVEEWIRLRENRPDEPDWTHLWARAARDLGKTPR